VVDDILKELRKNGEKLMIRLSAAGTACQESSKNSKEVEDSAEEELESLKKYIQGTAESLGGSIKGQFGKKAQASLEKHGESLK